jgi:nucleoside-diphosphate-sugar epimerase
MHLCADISNLTRDTGFVPEVDFEQGIENTVQWVKKKYKM